MGIWKQFKKFWMLFAEWIARVQTAVMLSVVYHCAVGPLSLFARVTGRELMPLKPEPGESRSYMVELPSITSTMERAKRQF